VTLFQILTILTPTLGPAIDGPNLIVREKPVRQPTIVVTPRIADFRPGGQEVKQDSMLQRHRCFAETAAATTMLYIWLDAMEGCDLDETGLDAVRGRGVSFRIVRRFKGGRAGRLQPAGGRGHQVLFGQV
jgi:hypothetical protein